MRFAKSLTLMAVSAGTAIAQPALDEGKPQPTTDATASPTSLTTAAEVEYGGDLRGRCAIVAEGLLEPLVEQCAPGDGRSGLGVDRTRRRGILELEVCV